MLQNGKLRVIVVKNPPANARDIRDMGLIPGSGRSLGERNGYPLQYSCLEKARMDRGGLWAIVHVVTKICRASPVTSDRAVQKH